MTVSEDLPSNFRRIRLELAREPGHPEGDRFTGYSLVAPLTNDDHLDIETARTYRSLCKVVRFRHDAESEEGFLIRRPGGSWAFHYDLDAGEDDDPGFKFDEHHFAIGEYVTLLEDEGPHTYRVVSVESV